MSHQTENNYVAVVRAEPEGLGKLGVFGFGIFIITSLFFLFLFQQRTQDNAHSLTNNGTKGGQHGKVLAPHDNLYDREEPLPLPDSYVTLMSLAPQWWKNLGVYEQAFGFKPEKKENIEQAREDSIPSSVISFLLENGREVVVSADGQHLAGLSIDDVMTAKVKTVNGGPLWLRKVKTL